MKKAISALLLCGALTLSAASAAAPAFQDTADLQPWAAEAVAYVSQEKIMNGTGGGMFSPRSYTDRATVATIIWRLENKPIGNITGTFTDVKLGLWYSDAVDWAAEADIITGSAGKFRPTEAVTRQDLAVMLYRYAGSPAADRSVLEQFADGDQVKNYALDAVSWAVDQGILTGMSVGSDRMLLPAYGATRMQVAAMLMRFLEE